MPALFKKKRSVFLIAAALLFPQLLIAQVMTSTTYQLRFDSANSGGGFGTSTSYQIEDTIGEIATGRSGSAPSNWFDTDWSYRTKVTINSGWVTSTLTDFPLYVDLSHMTSDFFTHVNSDGSDIRVLEGDGTTETPFEVVTIDKNASTGELHLLIDSLSSSSDTDFYIYYGNAAASAYATNDTYGSENVWSDYSFVHHLQETPAGAGSVVDSSGNSNDGTPNSMNISNVVSGKLSGNAYDFDGDLSTDYVNLGNGNLLSGGGPFTISAWVKYESLPVAGGGDSARTIAGEYYSTTGYRENLFELVNYGGGVMQQRFIIWDGSNNSSFATGTKVDWVADTWYYQSLSVDSSDDVSLYVNGVQDGSTVSFSNYWYGGSADMYIGAVQRSSTTPDREMDGVLDEVRISSTDRSEDWLYTEYFNQKHSLVLYTVHEEEDQYGTYVLNAGFQQMNETFLSISLVNDVILQPGVGIIANNSVASELLRVRSDNPAGYNLYVKTTQSPALQKIGGGTNFSDYSPGTPSTPDVWSVDSGESQFGYSVYDMAGGDVSDGSWGTADDCGSTTTGDPDAAGGAEQLYDAVTTTNRVVAQRSARTSDTGSDIVFCFAAGTNDGVVEDGDYQAPIVVTAIAL